MTLAIIFDSVGAGEWLVLLAVLLVVMGPKRLPSTARTIGSYYSKFRRAAESFKRQLMDMDYEMERELDKARREAEAAMTIPDDPPEFTEGVGESSSASEEEHSFYDETGEEHSTDDETGEGRIENDDGDKSSEES